MTNSVCVSSHTVSLCVSTTHNDVISCQVFKHPNYNGYTINNDILLIKLASPAQMGMRVSPVCVAETADNFPGGMRCVTSGWGLTRYNGESTCISRPIRAEQMNYTHGDNQSHSSTLTIGQVKSSSGFCGSLWDL